MKHFHYKQPFRTEGGAVLPGITIAYDTYGKLNADGSNVVWVCHALTASSAVTEWWPGVVGEGCAINPADHFIVCANILGSCYGSTGPLSINEARGSVYYHRFPQLTIRDMAAAHALLRQHLGIKKIALLMGGSMGGYQALEWCVLEPDCIDALFLIATNARESAWGIAVHTAQRMAIEADSTWKTNEADAGKEGLKAARAIGMLTYRGYETFAHTQTDEDNEKLDGFRASSYMHHQGAKLAKRFNAFSYWQLTKAMDSHNLARGRSGSLEVVLRTIPQRTLLLSITSDLLCPVKEMKLLADHLPDNTFIEVDSLYGHDGFLVEHAVIHRHLLEWFR